MTSRTLPGNHRGADGRGLSSGFTLIELLLVLALVVAIGALTLPVLVGPLEGQRLRKAADGVRMQWAKTRIKAMQDGQIYVFQYEVASPQYVIGPWYSESDYIEGSLETRQELGGPASATAAETGLQLPEGIVFAGGQSETTGRSVAIEQALLGSGTAQPILFYPDGTTSNAEVVLANQRQSAVVIRLRGLTGATDVSDTTSLDQLQTASGL